MTSTGALGLGDRSQHLPWELRQRGHENMPVGERVCARVCRSIIVDRGNVCE